MTRQIEDSFQAQAESRGFVRGVKQLNSLFSRIQSQGSTLSLCSGPNVPPVSLSTHRAIHHRRLICDHFWPKIFWPLPTRSSLLILWLAFDP